MPLAFPRRRADRFAELVDQPAPQRRPGPEDHNLSDLADIADDLRYAGVTTMPDPGFRTDLRNRLIAAAGGSELVTSAPKPHGRRARVAATIGLAAGVLGAGGLAVAGSSAPGGGLHLLQRTAEDVQLAAAVTNVDRGMLYLAFARNRLHQVGELSGDPAEVRTSLDDMDNDIRKGVRLLTTAAVTTHDPHPLDIVAAFIVDQAADMPETMDDLTGAAHGRVIDSNNFLNEVQIRIGWLRADLSCTDIQTTRVDEFGPVPQSCAARDSQRPSRSRSTPPSTVPPAPTVSPAAEPPAPAGTAASPTSSPAASALPSPAIPPVADPVQEVVKAPDVIEVDPQSPAPSPLREPPVDMPGLPSLVGDS